MQRKYYFLVTNIVTNKSTVIEAYDKFSAIARAVENDNYKYTNSQYKAQMTKM